MTLDKTLPVELRRLFLVEALPEPLTRSSAHLQIFDNYVFETRLRLRLLRVPETKEWTYILQQTTYSDAASLAERKVAEIHLNEPEYENFKVFEGNEIRKNRYFHEFDGRVFSFDVYLGPLWGLNRAAVQFASREDMETFVAPPWATIDISERAFFDDANLVKLRFEDIQAELNRG